MGGQGALRFAFKHPQLFPIVAAISPAIDYQMRYYDEEEVTIPQMYDDPKQARQDTATLHVHPLNWPRNIWFCAIRPTSVGTKARRAPAHEAVLAGHHARVRSGDLARRARLGVLQPSWRRGRLRSSPSAWSRSDGGCRERRGRGTEGWRDGGVARLRDLLRCRPSTAWPCKRGRGSHRKPT